MVMPVFNEEGCIGEVVRSWRDTFVAGGIDFLLILVDDGSQDGTGDILRAFIHDERIRVIRQAHQGHGRAILEGYRHAVRVAGWVFQCDSDNELPADRFGDFWEGRQGVDAVLGSRQHRRQNLQRRLISGASRMTVVALFGRGVTDVNVPYRLMRSEVLRSIVADLPLDTVAPNLLISGALVFSGARLKNLPVPHRPRRTGRVSLVRWRLWRAAARSFRQTWRYSRRLRRSGPGGRGIISPCGCGRQ
jgi:dolichol-phosphate mannosyltransferase